MSQGSAVAAQQAISIRVSRSGSAVVRRACDCGEHTTGGGECEECRKKRKVLQRKTASVSAPSIAPAVVHEALSSPGFALGQGSLDFFQPRLDRDFSSVRVHTGEKEAASALALGARAYTVGRDIVFATGQFAPESRDGRWLLAHELAHVAQQADGSVGRAPQALEVGSPGDPLEREADLIANAITGPQLHASGKSETSAGAEGPGRMPIHRALMRVQRAGGDEKTRQAGGTQHHSAAPTHGNPAPGTRVDAFGKECPDTVSIGALKAAPTFEKKMLDAGFKTYLATVSNMKVGPKTSYESCITEKLRVVEDTCGSNGNMKDVVHCGEKRHCMQIGHTCGGDTLGYATFPCSSTTFVDRHESSNPLNVLEGTGKSACRVKCLQRYGCGGVEIGRFLITRNYRAGRIISNGASVPITTGTIDKVVTT